MVSVGETLANVVGLALFAFLFLTPLQLVGAYRLRRARALGRERSYVPHADPWLSAVTAAAGAAALLLLRLLS
jgi:hypothetical protein